MATGTITETIAIGGEEVTATITRAGALAITARFGPNENDTFPAGKAGTLTTRTDDDTGILTVAEGHGITDSDTVDIYWDGGVQYGADVTGTTGTTISIDLGLGDNLPSESTVIVVTKRITVDFDIDGDNVKMLAFSATTRAHCVLAKNDDTVIKAQELTANEPWQWVSDQGITNPLTGDPIGKAEISNGSTTDGAFFLGAIINPV